MNLDLPQYAQYQKQISAGTFDAAIGGFGGSGNPYTDFNNALNSKYATPINTPTVNNFERFKNPTVDQALSQLAAATDTGAQTAGDTQAGAGHVQPGAGRPACTTAAAGACSRRRTSPAGRPPDDPYMLPTTYNNAMLVVVTHLREKA